MIETLATPRLLGVLPDGFRVYSISGSERGITTEGDALVTHLNDGTALNDVWGEFQSVLNIWNTQRTAITNLLSHRTDRVVDAVAQTTSRDEFEIASELGAPQSMRVSPDILTLGNHFEWYDAASRFSWKALAEMNRDQIEATHALALESDNRNTTRAIMRQLLTPVLGENDRGHTVYPLFNGEGAAPPARNGREFNAGHTHYVSSNGPLTGSDVEWAYDTIREHGYVTPSSRLLILANPGDARDVSRFRANTVAPDMSVTSYDFIPGQGAPAYLTDQEIVGARAPEAFERLPIVGSYGPGWLIESEFIPEGYVIVVATGGSNSDVNPVSFREHRRPELRGLRLLPGSQSGYPLTGGYYSRGFGTGVRHRGAAAVIQVSPDATYTPPAL